jgi:hypothetical protein
VAESKPVDSGAPKPKRSHKSTGTRIDPKRIDRAEELFAGIGPEGVPFSTRKIEKMLREEFGVSKSQANVYLQFARARLKAASMQLAENPESIVERGEAMMLEAFAKAREKHDASSMVQAAQRLAELRGVFSRKVNVEGKFSGLADALASVFDEVRGDAVASTQSSNVGSGAKALAK